MRPIVLWRTVCALTVVAALPALGADGGKCSKPADSCCRKAEAKASGAPAKTTVRVVACPKNEAEASGGAGMRAYVDPSGALTGAPTAEQRDAHARAEGARAPRASRAPKVTRHANGAVSMTVPDSLMDYSVVQVTKDGGLVRRCVQGEENAERAVKDGTIAPALEEK